MILNALKIIGRGFLLGVGFGIAMGGASYLMWAGFESRDKGYIAQIEEDAAKDLVLVDVEEQKREGETAILGSVKNTGSKPRQNIKLRANLFNHGKFVDQYSTYVDGRIEPGASEYFKISCGCKNSPPAEHDSFKVEIVKGF